MSSTVVWRPCGGLRDCTTDEQLAEVENQARDVESEIRGLKDEHNKRLDRDKDLLVQQEQEAVASGRSYLDRTPVGGLSGVGDSLKSVNIGKMGAGTLDGGAFYTVRKRVYGGIKATSLAEDGSTDSGRLARQVLESIKRSMEDSNGGVAAPWDARGRPLGDISSPSGTERIKVAMSFFFVGYEYNFHVL